MAPGGNDFPSSFHGFSGDLFHDPAGRCRANHDAPRPSNALAAMQTKIKEEATGMKVRNSTHEYSRYVSRFSLEH